MFVISEADKRGVLMKKHIKTGIFMSGALSAALLSGCGTGNQVVDYGKPQEEPVTITFLEINMKRRT